jgi:hypothetical protein
MGATAANRVRIPWVRDFDRCGLGTASQPRIDGVATCIWPPFRRPRSSYQIRVEFAISLRRVDRGAPIHSALKHSIVKDLPYFSSILEKTVAIWGLGKNTITPKGLCVCGINSRDLPASASSICATPGVRHVRRSSSICDSTMDS